MFGWSGGKQLVGTSYSDAKAKSIELKQEHAEKRAAKKQARRDARAEKKAQRHSPRRGELILTSARAWLERNARVVAAVLIILLAAALLRNGVSGLTN